MPLDQGVFGALSNQNQRTYEAAKSAIFLVAYYLVKLGYFLGLTKSILVPTQVVTYLGFLSDSTREVFDLILSKRQKFLELVRELLTHKTTSAALLFTREVNQAIAKGSRTAKPVRLN